MYVSLVTYAAEHAPPAGGQPWSGRAVEPGCQLGLAQDAALQEILVLGSSRMVKTGRSSSRRPGPRAELGMHVLVPHEHDRVRVQRREHRRAPRRPRVAASNCSSVPWLPKVMRRSDHISSSAGSYPTAGPPERISISTPVGRSVLPSALGATSGPVPSPASRRPDSRAEQLVRPRA